MGSIVKLIGFLVLTSAMGLAQAGADITVIPRDGAGEGFNDLRAPDGDSTAGGNPGMTLGAQRLIAFRHAAGIWARLLDSPVRIRIDASFDPLPCNASSAVLGAAGATTVHRDFDGARVENTWYVQALANALAGRDLARGVSDIEAEFNSAVGTTCALPAVWYYGLDGRPPGTTIDFVTVVLHEIAHGLGFQSFVDLATGEKLRGLDDIYMRRLENSRTGKRYPQMTDRERIGASRSGNALKWTGRRVTAASGLLIDGVDPSGQVEMFAPRPQEPGSSVSHFSTSLSPNQLMEPVLTGPDHVPDLDLPLLLDLGWKRGVGADLSIDVLDFPDPVPQGHALTYLITIRNDGPEVATNVTLTDTLPDGVTFLSAAPSQGACLGMETATTTCTLGTLAGGAVATVSIQVLVMELGVITHTAIVTGDRDFNAQNNTAVDSSVVNVVPAGLLCNGRPVTLVGSEGPDTITGTQGPDVIHALGGSDVIDGLQGRDHICAGAGRDTVRGGPGADFLSGQTGRDTLIGESGRDRLSGGAGVDRCEGGAGRDRARACEQVSGVP
ncbi:MAG: hypothetical protein ACT4QB_21825 [Gammaproteobacteria bacterium]